MTKTYRERLLLVQKAKLKEKKKTEKGYAIRKRNGVSFSLSVFRIP